MNPGDLVRLTTDVSLDHKMVKAGLIGLVLSESIVNYNGRNCFLVLWQGYSRPADTFEGFLEVFNEKR